MRKKRAGKRQPAKESDAHGYHFKSGMEARFADELEERLRHGKIAGWAYEPMVFHLTVNGHLVARYTPDFIINHLDGEDEIVEVKGFWRPDAKLRVKLFKALYSDLKFTVVGTPLDKRRRMP